MVADDKAEALEELGLDPALIVDAGKNPYLPKEDYYCAPRTEMAEEMIYSKIDAIGVLKWYFAHPAKLWYMLDYAASQAAEKMPDFFLYVGEKTTQEHRTVSKFNVWGAIRGGVTPNAFWQYILLYGTFIIFCGKKALSKKEKAETRLLSTFFAMLILVGSMQFPLSVVGNGFIDNVKQLFVFRLVHDIVITCVVFYCIIWIQKTFAQDKTGNRVWDKFKKKRQS